MAGEEPFAPILAVGQCARDGVAGKVRHHALPGRASPCLNFGGGDGLQALGISLGDGKRPAATVVTAGPAHNPVARPLSRLFKSGVRDGL